MTTKPKLTKAQESTEDYERRCSFDEDALGLARELFDVFADLGRTKQMRITLSQIAITELLMRRTKPVADDTIHHAELGRAAVDQAEG